MSEVTFAVTTVPPPPHLETGQRILIIDDEVAIRESLETLLSIEGYTVEMAANGEEGLDRIEQSSYDLVLLDLALPGKNGLEVLPLIRERQPALPVIMITAYGKVDNVVDAIRTGAQNFVQKPGTMKNFWPTFAPRSGVTTPKKRIFNLSGRSSSDTTSRTLSARANR